MDYIHISFGPVQTFISQARKTQDLWSGSYLLSTLARAAVHTVLKKYPTTEIVRPYLKPEAKKKLRESTRVEGIDTRVGTFPNLMEFRSDENAEEIAAIAIEGWSGFWREISRKAKMILFQILGGLSGDFEQIWERQIESVWEYYWAIGEYSYLTRRKAIRMYPPSPEEGKKCTICGTRETLRNEDWRSTSLKSFWSKIGEYTPLSIKDDGSERLCAICYIRRVSPGILSELLGSDDSPFPSTTSLSLLPWRLRLLESNSSSVKQSLKEYLEVLKKHDAPRLRSLWDRKSPSPLLDYDGDYFLPSQIRNEKIDHSTDACEELLRYLGRLRNSANSEGVADFTPYYAVLAMDGDSLGETISKNPDKKDQLSERMSEFAKEVPRIVGDNWGRLVYAGGDDVLALMPIHTILETSLTLRNVFIEKMKEIDVVPTPTISAGIVLAHLSSPLSSIISRSHFLLEDVAKGHEIPEESTVKGMPVLKDAFAIETSDRGGPSLRMVKKWESKERGVKRNWMEVIIGLRSRFSVDAVMPLTSSFLYSIADLLRRTDWSRVQSECIENLFLIDYFQSRDKRISKMRDSPEKREESLRLMSELVDLANQSTDYAPLNPDHILMLQFISRGGV